MSFKLITLVKKRDAILLYVFCAARLRRDPDALRSTSFERLAVALNDATCQTGRGRAFTAAVVRSCVAELERAGVAIREEINPGVFDLTLLDPDAADDAPRERSSKSDETQKNAEFSELSADSNERRFDDASGSSRARENINKINKLINKNCCSPKRFKVEGEQETRPTVDEVVARFDLNDPRATSLREKLVRRLHEPGLHADLIDRAVCAAGNHIVSSSELSAAVRIAEEEKRVRETTNGFKGAKTLWQTFCLYVKSWYDAAGIRWTPTSFRREPPPTPRRRLVPPGVE